MKDRSVARAVARALLVSTVVIGTLVPGTVARSHPPAPPSAVWRVGVAQTTNDGSAACAAPGSSSYMADPDLFWDTVQNRVSYDIGWVSPIALVGTKVRIQARPIAADGVPGAWTGVGAISAWSSDCRYGPAHHYFYPWTAAYAWEVRFLYDYQGTTDYNRIYGTASTTAAFDPPAAPGPIAAMEITSCTVTLGWMDNSPTEGRHELQRARGDGAWNLIAEPGENATSYLDNALDPSTTYRYRVRAINRFGASAWSNVADALTQPPARCDSDGDGLSDQDERRPELSTNPKKADTDGDGLLDPWEVRRYADDGTEIEGAGFAVPSSSLVIPKAVVFGPYATGPCPSVGLGDRPAGSEACLNAAPDPNHKDVFLEIDWQDCHEGSCPPADPLHHAPSIEGLQKVVAAFASAPVSNPDGTTGVNVRILVDEALPHDPDCDQDLAEARLLNFGTAAQRDDVNDMAIIRARENAVRYVWSGHSTAHATDDHCVVSEYQLARVSLGTAPIPEYDWTPFGDADVAGRDILVSMGPLWSCPVTIWACDRNGDPGLYPGYVNHESFGGKDLPWPIARMLGVPEEQGIVQLWSRTVMHLLGHSLGLGSESAVLNDPDLPAIDSDGNGRTEIRPVDLYTDWAGLKYAPPADPPLAMWEGFPNYDGLASRDSDLDGTLEGADNCPGVWNADQRNDDQDNFGAACDPLDIPLQGKSRVRRPRSR